MQKPVEQKEPETAKISITQDNTEEMVEKSLWKIIGRLLEENKLKFLQYIGIKLILQNLSILYIKKEDYKR